MCMWSDKDANVFIPLEVVVISVFESKSFSKFWIHEIKLCFSKLTYYVKIEF